MLGCWKYISVACHQNTNLKCTFNTMSEDGRYIRIYISIKLNWVIEVYQHIRLEFFCFFVPVYCCLHLTYLDQNKQPPVMLFSTVNTLGADIKVYIKRKKFMGIYFSRKIRFNNRLISSFLYHKRISILNKQH